MLASEHEALGTSLLEAQSCGVPVLAANVGGIPEALEEGKTGYLFDDFDMLEKQLNNILGDDTESSKVEIKCKSIYIKNFFCRNNDGRYAKTL